jgi:hypothetical protein
LIISHVSKARLHRRAFFIHVDLHPDGRESYPLGNMSRRLLKSSFPRFACGLLALWLTAQICPAQNLALQLDGHDSYVQLPSNLFTNLTEATVEVWARWETFENYSRVFEFGAPWRSVSVFNLRHQPDLRYNVWPHYAKVNPALQNKIEVPGILRSNEWTHIAAVSGPGGMLLYVNGRLVGSHTNEASFAALGATPTNYLGRGLSGNAIDRDFNGEIDELRVWNYRRSEAQIRDDMYKRLSGKEAGLVYLLNFDDGTVSDATGHAAPGKMFGQARIVASDLGLVAAPSPAPLAAAPPPNSPTLAVAPAPATAPAPNLATWWIAGGFAAVVMLLGSLVWMLRRSGANSTRLALPAGATGSSDHVHPDELKRQALDELKNFAKESLVQGLYSQRAALLEAHKQAAQEVVKLEMSLMSMRLPERIQGYEQRIAELEGELASREGELREMTLATLQLLRQKVAEEKLQVQSRRGLN